MCRVGVLSSEISKISPPPSLRSHLTSSPMGVLLGDYVIICHVKSVATYVQLLPRMETKYGIHILMYQAGYSGATNNRDSIGGVYHFSVRLNSITCKLQLPFFLEVNLHLA